MVIRDHVNSFTYQHQAFVSHAQSSINNIEQQIQEIEKPNQGNVDHQHSKKYEQKPSGLERRETEQNIAGENRASSWGRNGAPGESDPPPPGLDILPSSTSNQQQERSKKRSSR